MVGVEGKASNVEVGAFLVTLNALVASKGGGELRAGMSWPLRPGPG